MGRIKDFFRKEWGATPASYGIAVALIAAALIMTMAAVRG
jgi:Flp pilus assembly pilin Flp